MLIHCSKKLLSYIDYLPSFFNSKVVFKKFYIILLCGVRLTNNSKLVVWGMKNINFINIFIAKLLRVGVIYLEDGFLRSIELGSKTPPLSIIVDDIGIYYDASNESKLERLIKEPLDKAQEIRTKNLINLWKEQKVSKYNYQTSYIPKHFPQSFVLVVDQTFGDASIKYGMATEKTFQYMLDSAIRETPNDIIVLKLHPEVLSGKKNAHFNIKILQNIPNLVLLTEDLHPALLLERAHTVYTVTSQMGFEALIWGKKVRVFGMPFYAGWGLTIDELPAVERRYKINLEQLVYASLIKYPKYINPETLELCEVEDTVRYIAFQKKIREKLLGTLIPFDINFNNYTTHYFLLLSMVLEILRFYFLPLKHQEEKLLALSSFHVYLTKVYYIKLFMRLSSLYLVKTSSKNAIFSNCCIIWGNKKLSNINAKNIIRVEDGFIRSCGLGAAASPPFSLVFDKSGIYFDATKASDLETILNNTIFDSEILSRAYNLRNEIIKLNITKYNMYSNSWERPLVAKKVILVPGQVEKDASIKYGMCIVNTNLDLLEAVRKENPNSYIIYKEHPDVVEGVRKNKSYTEKLTKYCDEILMDISISMLYPLVDEVHLMTSLAGFEALLRNKKVICYGNPFYSGWGLTIDKNPIERRTRKLSLDELVAGALILYPTYISRVTGRYTTPERVILEISELSKNYKHSAFTKIYTWLRRKWNLMIK